MSRIFGYKLMLLFALLVAGLLALEMDARKQPRPQKDAIPRGAMLCASDGSIIADRGGPIKLLLSPYLVYKNFPSQTYPGVTINSSGFRGRETPFERGRKKRIILVGGSALFGDGVRDEETIGFLLEGRDPNSEVLNAGVLGYHSGQELVYVVTELVDYDPDLIISYSGWNDLYQRLKGHSLKEEEKYFDKTQDFIEGLLRENYTSRTRPARSLRRLLFAVASKSALFRSATRGIEQRKRASRMLASKEEAGSRATVARTVRVYAGNMEKSHDFCARRGIGFAVVFQPEMGAKPYKSPWETVILRGGNPAAPNYGRVFPRMYRDFIEQAKRRLTARGIPYVDVGAHPLFREAQEELFLDVVHTNKKGNEIVATILKEFLDKIETRY